MNPLDMDSAEIRILRAITELNNRLIMCQTPEPRSILRGSIESLRRELISLVESIHIYSEDDVHAALRHGVDLVFDVPNGRAVCAVMRDGWRHTDRPCGWFLYRKLRPSHLFDVDHSCFTVMYRRMIICTLSVSVVFGFAFSQRAQYFRPLRSIFPWLNSAFRASIVCLYVSPD